MHPGLQYLSNRWATWVRGSTNRKIFSAALTIAFLTLIVKLFSIAKELLVANQFGTGDALDAFIIAFLLPSFIINVVAGSIKSALIPVYINLVETKSPDQAKNLLSGILFLALGLLIAASLLLVLAAPYILHLLASGFSAEKLILTQSLLFILLPVLVIGSLSSIFGAILNAGERFALVALAPVIIQLTAIAALIVFGDRWGIYALTAGTTIGFIIEFFWIALVLKRLGLIAWPRWSGMDTSTRQVINQFLPMATGIILMSSTELVDQAMAAMLGSGSVSTLSYSNKIVSLLTGIGSMALGTAIFPYFSKQAATQNWQAIHHTLIIYMRLILLITVPLVMLTIYFSYPLIEVIFERGAFGSGDTQLVSHVQTFYLLQIPFYMLGIMCARLLNALSRNHLLMNIGFISLVINIAGNFILMKHLGVAGIALSTSIVYLTSFLLMFYYIKKFTGLRNYRDSSRGAQ